MKKRFLAILLSAVTALSLGACGAAADLKNETADGKNMVTVTTLDGSGAETELEVPFEPERIAVLDMAALDIVHNLGLGESVVGVPKASKVDYLTEYLEDDEIVNLGTLKEVDMEALMACEPEVIFIGGRLGGQYEELSAIAPVIYMENDYEKGLLRSLSDNVELVASLFGKEETAREKTADFFARTERIREAAQGKTAVIGLATSGGFNTLGNLSRGSLIGNEAGFENLADNTDSTHGNESSFELLTKLDPEYLFVLDRDSAIGAEGAQLARDLMDNDLIRRTTAHRNDNIIYLNPTAWYLTEGGITAMDLMLEDLERALLL